MMNFGAISYTSIRIYSLFKSWLKKFGFALSEFICNHVLDELSPDYLDNNHIMHKTVINATIVKTKHTLLASTE